MFWTPLKSRLTPSPDLFLGSDTLTCAGNSLILDAGQHDSYLWSDNSTFSTLSPDFSVSGQYAYSVIVTNSFGCTASDEINIEVQDCASVEDVSLEDIIFYPNPFREVIYSNINLEEYEISVYDLNGKIVPVIIVTNKIYFNKSTSIIEITKTGLEWKLIIK